MTPTVYRWDVYVLTWDHIESQIGDYSTRMKCHSGHFELYMHFNTFTYIYNKPLHSRKLTWDPPKNEGLVFYRDVQVQKMRVFGVAIYRLNQRKKTVQRGAFSRPTAMTPRLQESWGELVQDLVMFSNPTIFFPDASMRLGTIWKLHWKPIKFRSICR